MSKYFLYLTALLFFSRCRKLAEVDPPRNQIVSVTVFENDGGAYASLAGVYSDMASGSGHLFSGGMTFYPGLAADELQNYTSSTRDEFQKNELTIGAHPTLETSFWSPGYKLLFSLHACLEGTLQSKTVSPAAKQQIEGEVRFLRAFVYFQLTQLFGDVPLVTSTDYRVNQSLPRAPRSQVFQFIEQDLLTARNLLSSAYPASERIRPNRAAAHALLTQVCAVQERWNDVETVATLVINDPLYTLAAQPSQVFLKGSAETIWQLQAVNPTINTYEGNTFLPATANSVPNYVVSLHLVNSFGGGDLRKSAWLASRTYLGQTVWYPAKYKVYGNNAPVSEHYVVLRLADLLLLRSEARAKNGDLTGAFSDLNRIRVRAGLPALSLNDPVPYFTFLQNERKWEFMIEWGHRWLDLKRWNLATSLLQPIKGGTWQATDTLWPIPQNQINLNPALTQNPGY